jgi:DNA polymerase elongation subunit (family B)
MKRVFIDIETLPTDEKNLAFVEKKMRKRFLRRGRVLEDKEIPAHLEIAFQNTALSGSLGRLLCIGIAVDADGKAENLCVCGQDKNTGEFHLDEARTLKQFWNYLERIKFDVQRDIIVGHNIIGFDLPFLYQRSMIFGVKPSFQLLNGKPWDVAEWVYDTMDRWQMGKCYEKVSLEELALAFGLDCPKDGAVNGENLLEAYLAGKHEEIREYCLKDVLCVRELYYRMTYQKMPEILVENTSGLALRA